MIWSYKELANLSLIGENAVVERVMKHLGDPENHDIFEKENFSYLWGALGIVGIKGVPQNILDTIWRTLKENGVLEAFDKGVLGDFNLVMMRNYPDNRLKAWKNFDNFTADQRFKKLILMPIVGYNRKYAEEVDTQAFNPIRVLGILERYPMSEAVKMMLQNLHGHGAACGILGQDIIEHYEKEKVLSKLCDIIAFSKRVLHEDEKDFLFRYIHDAVVDGFLPENIGLRDEVFAGLMSDRDDMDNMSELELSHLRERNGEIVEFAKEFDFKLGFFEKSAVKLIRYNPAYIPEMVQRCIGLMNTSVPKGLVFALELINLKQIKSAVSILIELAKRGKATEMASFLHRLLPNVKGAENMITNILKLNLKMLKEKNNCWDNSFFREYPARIYISAVKVLEENGLYKDAGMLLYYLVMDDWISGIKDLEEECVDTANLLLSKHKDLEKTLSLVANKLNLNMYRGNGEVYILYNAKAGVDGNVRKTYERFLGDIKEIEGVKSVSKGVEKNNQIKESIKPNIVSDSDIQSNVDIQEVMVNKTDGDVFEDQNEENITVIENETKKVVEESGYVDENIGEGIIDQSINVIEPVSVEEDIFVNDEVFVENDVLQDEDVVLSVQENENIIENDDFYSIVAEEDVEINELEQSFDGNSIDDSVVGNENINENVVEENNVLQEDVIDGGEGPFVEVVKEEVSNDDKEVLGNTGYTEEVAVKINKTDDFVSIFGESESKVSNENVKENVVDEIKEESKKQFIENDVKQWDEEEDNKVVEQRGVKKFLKINTKDLDKHFEKIKEITSNTIKRVDNIDKHFDKIKEITNDVVQRAEEKAKEIKQKVEDKDIENIKSIAGIKKIADKFKGFRKKQ